MSPSAVPQDIYSLPAPLYYLLDGQIWRIEPDASSTQQITSEDEPVLAFDISPADGRITYISNNNLFIITAEGADRQILLSGSELPPYQDELARLNDQAHITTALHSPHWSADGQKIAFVCNGLMLFNITNNDLTQVFTYADPLTEPNLIESVLSWSPDAQHFLISFYTYPLDSIMQLKLGLYTPDGYLYELGELFLTSFAWTPDSTQLILANAAFGEPRSLLSCDLATIACTMIAEYEPARWHYHYAYPFFTREERFLVFMGTTNDGTMEPDTFRLISLQPDGSDRRNLRDDGYKFSDALWSPHGDGILGVLAEGTDSFPAKSVLWLTTTNRPASLLPVMNIENLRWGHFASQ